jgi:hypothetical protein
LITCGGEFPQASKEAGCSGEPRLESKANRRQSEPRPTQSLRQDCPWRNASACPRARGRGHRRQVSREIHRSDRPTASNPHVRRVGLTETAGRPKVDGQPRSDILVSGQDSDRSLNFRFAANRTRFVNNAVSGGSIGRQATSHPYSSKCPYFR